MDFLWTYVLGSIAILSIIFFLLTFSRDIYLIKKLKLNRSSLAVNFSLLMIACISVGIVVYLFILLKNQINLLG
ncbi:hypothetical protein [Vagococcus fluvialis]|uniref:hypothetical protein n=1 Tax=Vagococcus fluvialis TaxID=2738 RepID=UPI001A8C7E6F|nr:hypothetical protein [Vagococcus fluvialis]MBO0428303.1 hypothetical protein [Vagococcus fluvialis]